MGIPRSPTALPPLTLARIQRLLHARGLSAELDDGAVLAQITGGGGAGPRPAVEAVGADRAPAPGAYPFWFYLKGDHGQLLWIQMAFPLPVIDLSTVRDHVDTWNREQPFPTAAVASSKDSGAYKYVVGGMVAHDYAEGATDAQLDRHIGLAIDGCMSFAASLATL